MNESIHNLEFYCSQNDHLFLPVSGIMNNKELHLHVPIERSTILFQ